MYRHIYLFLVLLLSTSSALYATEDYSYLSYIPYPKSELRGYSIERLPSGQLELHKFSHPVTMPGATPIGGYLATNPNNPNTGNLFLLGITPTGPRKVFDCGVFDVTRINVINCQPLANSAVYAGTNMSGGIRSTGGAVLSVNKRQGNKDFVQGLRLGGPVIRAQSKFSFFAAPYKLNEPLEITSQSMSWDASLIGKTTTSQFVFRELTTSTAAGKGPTAAFNYNPASRVGSLNVTLKIGTLYGVYWREQRNVGTANAQSSVWTARLTVSPTISFVNSSFTQIAPWKKTGNTNAELFQSVAVHPQGDYTAYTKWLPSCQKFGLVLRLGNPDGTFKAPRNLETCGTLGMDVTVGVLGINISPTYETD